MFVKKGDKVVVIAGKDKGKTANVLEVSPSDNKVLVEGVNVVKRHQKPRSQEDKGGIIEKSIPMEASNVMVVCPVCDKATRVKHNVVEGKKVRTCTKCGASIEKETAKKAKKAAKKEVAEKETTEKKTTKKTTAKKAEAK
ncbi:MAG: 50S ribosomal protein L24 [Clostridia bacterium]|nr:50S ribosomal protein L24 [Clostridia bacterium]